MSTVNYGSRENEVLISDYLDEEDVLKMVDYGCLSNIALKDPSKVVRCQ